MKIKRPPPSSITISLCTFPAVTAYWNGGGKVREGRGRFSLSYIKEACFITFVVQAATEPHRRLLISPCLDTVVPAEVEGFAALNF